MLLPDMRKVSYKNLPVSMPVSFTLTILLGLDHFHAPGWVWGVAGTLLVVVWVILLYLKMQQEQIDVFEKRDDKPKWPRSS